MSDGSLVTRANLLLRHGILPALALIGPRFASPQAVALMLAIAMQESRVEHRAQIGGPARGFWQFERGGGVRGVLEHGATRDHAQTACRALLVEPAAAEVYRAIQYHDVLAAVFARLLLWSSPSALPAREDGPDAAWEYYLDTWRPGKPHRATWDAFWHLGWSVSIESGVR